MKKTLVISLGGSLIIPKKMDISFLQKFKKTLEKHYKTHKFIIVCGGGVIARKYISALKAEGKSRFILSKAGIRATRENALFLMDFFGKNANSTLPKSIKQVVSQRKHNNVVICGALRYTKKSTSDTTAAKLAKYLKTRFINMTNVPGLYNKDPKKNKNAKFISQISHSDFHKMAKKVKYRAGQNFILDQSASKIIKKNRITTYLIGKDIGNLEKILNNKNFKGTIIR